MFVSGTTLTTMLADTSFIVSSPESEQYSNQHQVKVLTHRRQRSRYLAPTSKRITLNVNGTRYQTYEETLNNFPNTLLGSSVKRESFYDERTQEYNLPRSKGRFDSILFYYQSRGILARPNTVSVNDFDEELQFYEISNQTPLRCWCATMNARSKIRSWRGTFVNACG